MWDRIALYGGAVAVCVGILWYVQHEPLPAPDEGVMLAMEMVGKGEMDEAAAFIEELREAYPDDLRIHHLRAWYFEGTGELARAQDAYRDSLGLCEDDDMRRHVMLFIANLDRRMGNLDRAEKYLELAEKQYGESRRSRLLKQVFAKEKAHIARVKTSAHVAETKQGDTCRPRATDRVQRSKPGSSVGKPAKSN